MGALTGQCWNYRGPQALLDRRSGPGRVSVCSVFYNKMPQTEWRINNSNLFITILEAGRLRLGFQHGQGRAPFWAADFSLCPHLVGRGESSLGSLRVLWGL